MVRTERAATVAKGWALEVVVVGLVAWAEMAVMAVAVNEEAGVAMAQLVEAQAISQAGVGAVAWVVVVMVVGRSRMHGICSVGNSRQGC